MEVKNVIYLKITSNITPQQLDKTMRDLDGLANELGVKYVLLPSHLEYSHDSELSEKLDCLASSIKALADSNEIMVNMLAEQIANEAGLDDGAPAMLDVAKGQVIKK